MTTIDYSTLAPPRLIDESEAVTVGSYAAWATYSQCMTYRLILGRVWGEPGLLVACLLNPSTATELVLDPTLRRVRDFAKRDGYGGFVIVNCFAYRSTDRRALRQVPTPVGRYNDQAIVQAIRWKDCARAVAGWGRPDNQRIAKRMGLVLALPTGKPWHTFGPCTKDGYPRHPLYLRRDTQIVKLAK